MFQKEMDSYMFSDTQPNVINPHFHHPNCMYIYTLDRSQTKPKQSYVTLYDIRWRWVTSFVIGVCAGQEVGVRHTSLSLTLTHSQWVKFLGWKIKPIYPLPSIQLLIYVHPSDPTVLQLYHWTSEYTLASLLCYAL